MDNPWKLVSIIFILLFALSVILGLTGSYDLASGNTLFSKSSGGYPAAREAVSFISNNLIGTDESVKLLNVTEESGVYRISTEFTSSTGNRTINAYMTKDGKYLFPASYQLGAGSQKPGSTVPAARGPAAVKKTCADIKKQDSPVIEAFVVSRCPYGTQMQEILADVVAKIPDLSKNIKVRYIGEISNGTVQSMHGSPEAVENLRQICIREEQPATYWKYVSCFISSPSSETCEKSTGVDTSKLSGCISNESRGIRYAQEDFTRSATYGVSGSPTLILNGVTVSEFDFGGRTPEAVKSLLCCGFNTQPDTCAISLGTLQAGTGQGTC